MKVIGQAVLDINESDWASGSGVNESDGASGSGYEWSKGNSSGYK